MKKLLAILGGAIYLGIVYFSAPTANAALLFVQATSTFQSGVTVATLTPSTASGNLLIMFEMNGGSPSQNNTTTDSAGQSWLLATTTNNGSVQNSLYYIPNSAAVTSVTCHWAAGTTNSSCAFFEVSGAATTNVLDGTATFSTTSAYTSATSSALTTTNANDFLIYGIRSGAAPTSIVAGAGYTIPAGATSSRSIVQYQIVSSIQTAVTTTIKYATAGTYEGVFAAFQQATVSGASNATQNSMGSGILNVSATLNVSNATINVQ